VDIRVKHVLIAAAALALLVPSLAQASAIQVIRDCSEDGTLDHKYSQRELSAALDQLPSDLDEYTDCRSVIRSAQLAGARKKGRGKGVLGLVDTKAPATSDEQRQLRQGSRDADEVDVGGRRVQPGDSGAAFAAAGLGTDLPATVLGMLVVLALAMVAGAGYAAQRRWPQAWAATAGAAAGPLRRLANGVKSGISRLRR
jgi:hypothetical protein